MRLAQGDEPAPGMERRRRIVLLVGDARKPIKVARGIASTAGLRIEGPSARVAMNGEVDLARETQRLNVRVTPSIGESVSLLGGLVGGPIAGLGIFAFHKIMPLDQFVAYEYLVTGTWGEPVVTKVQRTSALEVGRPE